MSEKNESRTQAIRGYVDGKIQWLWDLPENQRRAELAQLPANIRLRWGQDLYRYEKNESSETQEKEN